MNVFKDIAKLKINPNSSNSNTRKILTNVPIRKPNKLTFNRTHPDENFRGDFGIVESPDDKKTYLVSPDVAAEISDVGKVRLTTTIDRQGNIFLWPLKIPNPEGRNENWSESALEAAELAQTKWIRIRANLSAGQYEIFEAEATIPEPEFPDKSFAELLELAFCDRVILNKNHPVIQKILGKL